MLTLTKTCNLTKLHTANATQRNATFASLRFASLRFFTYSLCFFESVSLEHIVS